MGTHVIKEKPNRFDRASKIADDLFPTIRAKIRIKRQTIYSDALHLVVDLSDEQVKETITKNYLS